MIQQMLAMWSLVPPSFLKPSWMSGNSRFVYCWSLTWRIFFFNFVLFLNFTILYWFCHISAWIRHRYTHVPHPELSSLLPPCTIPLGCPSAPAPNIQYRASNLDLDWWLVVYSLQHELWSLCGDKKNTYFMRPHRLYSPWNSPGQNTGVGSCSLLQGIFLTQGSNPGLLHCRGFFTVWATKEAQQ